MWPIRRKYGGTMDKPFTPDIDQYFEHLSWSQVGDEWASTNVII